MPTVDNDKYIPDIIRPVNYMHRILWYNRNFCQGEVTDEATLKRLMYEFDKLLSKAHSLKTTISLEPDLYVASNFLLGILAEFPWWMVAQYNQKLKLVFSRDDWWNQKAYRKSI